MGLRRVQDAGHLFQGVDQARAGVDDGLGNKVHTVALHGVKLFPAGQTLELIKRGRERFAAREQDDVRVAMNHLFETKARPFALKVFRNRDAARALDDVSDKGVRSGRDQRAIPDDKEDFGARQARHALLDGLDPSPQRLNQGARFSPPVEHLTYVLDGAQRVIHAVGGEAIDRNAQPIELVCGLAAVGLRSAQDEVRLQGHDLFNIRTKYGADVRLLLGFGRVIAVVRVAYQAVSETQRVEGFCDTRRERDETIGLAEGADSE